MRAQVKLYMDDVRPAPDPSWTVARTIEEAKTHLATRDVIAASLDHDMGACEDCTRNGRHVGDMRTPETTFSNWCRHAPDGYALVVWMLEHGHRPPLVTVHSMNPIGRSRMIELLRKNDLR